MHEVSLAAGILRIVEEAAAREGFTHAATLRLEVGRLASVEVTALCFALQAVSPGSVLEGCLIEIDRPSGRAFCFGCGQSVELAALGDACPACGAQRLQPTAGNELRVLELSVRGDVGTG